MSEPIQTIEPAEGVHQPKNVAPTPPDKPVWETPKLEDVSEQVMAQPSPEPCSSPEGALRR